MYTQDKVTTPTFSARRSRRYGVSALAIGALLMAMPSFAQTSEVEEDEVVATGIRQSLQNAQDIKRDADTFVDSITADDIGSLPDVSVLEALQRVPGISISRFAAGDDPDHFNVEGSGVVVRGLTYVRSEFNGRDAFSAGNGNGLGFQDVPPELVGGVDVFKNQTADMIEGGIAGVVNLRTLKPFDRAESSFVISAEGTYADMAEEWSPALSATGSYRWDTAAGEFGILGSISSSNLKTRSDAIRVAPFYGYRPNAAGDGFLDANSSGGTQSNLTDNIAAPAGINTARQEFDRDRLGITLNGQWQSNDGRHLATAEFIRSDSSDAWVEHTLQTDEDPNYRRDFSSLGSGTVSPFGAEVFRDRDDTGTIIPVNSLFSAGTLTGRGLGWESGGQGILVSGATRVSNTESVVDDYSFNYKFTPNDQWKFNFDVQMVQAERENSDLSAFTGQYLDIAFDLAGDVPTVEYLLPQSQVAILASQDSILDTNASFWRAAMDHFEESEGEEIALRADAEYDFDSDGWFKSVRFGARYAEREQLNKWTSYNWGNVSEQWNGGFATAANNPDVFEEYTFDNFHRGGTLNGQTTFNFIRADILSSYASQTSAAAAISPGLPQWGRTQRRLDGEDIFLPSEISDVTEETSALYARVDFGQDSVEALGGISVDGNYGVRVVKTEVSTDGFIEYQENTGLSCVDQNQPGDMTVTVRTQETIEACALLNSGAEEVAFSNDYVDILPSANLKLGVTEDVIVRFAASQGIFRPGIGLLRAARNVSGNFENDNSGIVVDPNTGNTSGTRIINFQSFTEEGGNPQLLPTKSVNLDASLEWYFDDVGSVTASFFYKDITDVIIGTRDSGAAGGGFTSVSGLPFQGSINNGGGEVSGYEIAYQQFYDQLPGLMSGFGVQANYTYIQQEAFPNSGADANRGGQQDFNNRFEVTDLEGLSEHTLNVVGLYENDTIEARLAYNWRSEFLLTTLDVITRLPVYHNDTGQLDASFKYNITDNFQIGVQGVNLTSEVTETELQFDAAGNRQPRAFYENDRRFILQGRYKF